MSEVTALRSEVKDLKARVEMLESMVKLLEMQRHHVPYYPAPQPAPLYSPVDPWQWRRDPWCGSPVYTTGGTVIG